jgi:hypothetical protein
MNKEFKKWCKKFFNNDEIWIPYLNYYDLYKIFLNEKRREWINKK